MKLRSENSVATALVLSFLVFYVSVPASAQYDKGHKYVRVTDADTQRAIKDAKVTIRDENGKVVTTGKTNASGMWDAYLKPGTYKIEVEKTGYGKAEGEFTIEAGATENNEFALKRVQKQSALETAWGLHTATFETPQGKIKVNVPDDMAAGDTISGTVIAEPSGKTQAERAKNQDALNGYVVEVEKQKTPVSEKVFQWAVPVGLVGGTASVILRDPKGKEVARTNVPVNPTPPRPPSNWSNPPVCQTGRPMSIPGPNSVDVPTEVTIGGENAEILAQSPRKIVAEIPQEGVLGKTEIQVRKGGETVHRGQIRAIGIQLSATSTTLRRGQQATLTVTARGLENLAPDEKVPVQLTNKTPGVVGLAGGNEQNFTIARGDPNLDPQTGIWTKTFTLTGIRPGGFTIQAQQAPQQPPQKAACKCQNVRVDKGTIKDIDIKIPVAGGGFSEEIWYITPFTLFCTPGPRGNECSAEVYLSELDMGETYEIQFWDAAFPEHKMADKKIISYHWNGGFSAHPSKAAPAVIVAPCGLRKTTRFLAVTRASLPDAVKDILVKGLMPGPNAHSYAYLIITVKLYPIAVCNGKSLHLDTPNLSGKLYVKWEKVKGELSFSFVK